MALEIQNLLATNVALQFGEIIFVNGTQHPIAVESADGTIHNWRGNPDPIRCEATTPKPSQFAGFTIVADATYGELNLPAPSPGVVWILSALALIRANQDGRKDCVGFNANMAQKWTEEDAPNPSLVGKVKFQRCFVGTLE